MRLASRRRREAGLALVALLALALAACAGPSANAPQVDDPSQRIRPIIDGDGG